MSLVNFYGEPKNQDHDGEHDKSKFNLHKKPVHHVESEIASETPQQDQDERYFSPE